MQSIEELPLQGARAWLRLDLNTPLEERDGMWVVRSDARIKAVLPTIQYALKAGAAVVLASHLGRPGGECHMSMSLDPIAVSLASLLGCPITLADDCIGDGVGHLVRELRAGEVLLLENLRFHAGETQNDPDFLARLVKPFDLRQDVYINDAFGASHRSHASIVGLPTRFENKGAGFLLQRELEALGRLRNRPKQPFVAVIGGAKVSDKIGVLRALLPYVDVLCIGGAMAYTMLQADGRRIGASRCESSKLKNAQTLFKAAQQHGVEIVLPKDHVVASTFAEDAKAQIIADPDIPNDQMGLDIGPKTRALFAKHMTNAKTVFWNGPMGVFEWEAFAAGTHSVAKAVGQCEGYTVVGGGDSIAAIEAAGVTDSIDHVSTGGGASLEFLQKGMLPGIKVLTTKP